MHDRLPVFRVASLIAAGILAVAVVSVSSSSDATSIERFVHPAPETPDIGPVPSTADTVDTRPLRLLMVELGQDMNRISDGLWHEDYDMIRRAGRSIADHPKIDSEQMETIRRALGDRFEQFVAYDRMVHDTADRLAAAASARNMQRLLEERNQLTNGCLGCHSTFRTEVRNALY